MADFSEDNSLICLVILTTIEKKRNNLISTGKWKLEKPHRFCHRLDIDLHLELLHRNALTYQHNYMPHTYIYTNENQYYPLENGPLPSGYPPEDYPLPTGYPPEDCPLPTCDSSIFHCTQYNQNHIKTYINSNPSSDTTNNTICRGDDVSYTDNNGSKVDFDHEKIMVNNIDLDFVSDPLLNLSMPEVTLMMERY